MKKIRLANKQKLKNIEWSDEAIEELSNKNSFDYNADVVLTNIESNPSFKDNMESKIARVQIRKQEAEQRKLKRSLLAPAYSRPFSILTQYSQESKTSLVQNNTNKLADVLNSYFSDFLDMNSELITTYEAYFPLEYYDSNEYNEKLLFKNLPSPGVCLMNISAPENSPRRRGMGVWYGCKVLEILAGDKVKVALSSIQFEEIQIVSKMQVCLTVHDVELYSDRLVDAIKKRQQCVSLMKYTSYVRNMPVNSKVTSSMTEKQYEKIYLRAANSSKLLVLDRSVGYVELDEAAREYEVAMNKVIFDANMLSLSNNPFFKSLSLSKAILEKQKKAPECAVVAVASYNLRHKIHHHQINTYLNSPAAVHAIQGLLKINGNIMNYLLMKLEFKSTLSLDKFERLTGENVMASTRMIKQDWIMKSGSTIRSAIIKMQESSNTSDCIQYDVTIKNVFDFEQSKNQIRNLLERSNYMMTDVLKNIVKCSLIHYTNLIKDLCACDVVVQDVKNIIVNMPPNCIYKTMVLPPLFSVAFRIASEEKVLNVAELDDYKKQMMLWSKTKEAENGEKCPIAIVKPIMGKTFEYSYSMDEFKNAVVKVGKWIVAEFQDVSHVQKFVMEKIYFPNPKFVGSVTEDLDWVIKCFETIEQSMDKATAPLGSYLNFFKKYEAFVNIDNTTYINSRITVNIRDPESTEIELPLSVNLNQMMSLIDEHYNQIKEIEESLPILPIECGLFLVEVVSVRNLLLDKHKKIIHSILQAHAERSVVIGHYLEEEFKKINKNLSKRPENIEELVELEEYVSSLGNVLVVLSNCIEDMLSAQRVLDKYKFKTDFDTGLQMWNIFAAPAKVALKCSEVQETNQAIKRKFGDEMSIEQTNFLKTLQELDEQVTILGGLTELSDVVNIAAKVKEVEEKIIVAQGKVKLFNSRETLFEKDITEYEDMNRVAKSFEPYSNLWQTAKEWIELSELWMKGKFVDLNADEVEKNVDKYNIAINKAAKYFHKADMRQQTTIANKIKNQVNAFLPEVPLIVTLRNPGMRDRHWQKIGEQLNVNVMPIEDFTTEDILALNLKESLELIQKIGESAAKEYQIENALNKMEKEWENMNLSIHPYRETGTGVIKGVDDINVVLDEQITMTQVIKFFMIY